MLLSLQPVDLCSLFKCYSSDDCEVNEMEIQQCVYCVISEGAKRVLSSEENIQETQKFEQLQSRVSKVFLFGDDLYIIPFDNQ